MSWFSLAGTVVGGLLGNRGQAASDDRNNAAVVEAQLLSMQSQREAESWNSRERIASETTNRRSLIHYPPSGLSSTSPKRK